MMSMGFFNRSSFLTFFGAMCKTYIHGGEDTHAYFGSLRPPVAAIKLWPTKNAEGARFKKM